MRRWLAAAISLSAVGLFADTAPAALSERGQPLPRTALGKAETTAALPRAFGVGETATYEVAVGGARVGEGSMSIVGTEQIRGAETYHSVLNVQGGLLFFKVNDRLESWFDPTRMVSHRFAEDINEGGYHRQRTFEIFPEHQQMQQVGKDTVESTVPDPLDDGSFFYFVRTVPLEVGQQYVFQRYYRPDKNPVIVKVLRKEKIKVKAGTFETIVIQPIIKSGGIFADGGEAYMWLSDDGRRVLVQFKAKVKILQSLDLYLKSYTVGTATAASGQ